MYATLNVGCPRASSTDGRTGVLDGRALHAPDRVVGDGVRVAEVLEQRGEGGQAVPDGLPGQAAAVQVVAPGDEVRPVTQRTPPGREMPTKRVKSPSAAR